ncbi:MAG: choice-of-anchor L domain-containing protein [Bacteroidota bacterium]
MHRILLIFPLLLLASGSRSTMPPPVLMGIQTSGTFSPTQLVRDIFVNGDCQNVSNVERIGNLASVGYFAGGQPIFGFDEGIIISSGDITLAEGPNETIQAGASFGDGSGDPDIDLFITNPAFDVAGIEFDFVPVGEQVTFNYVFASEEYCEFVGSIFNDVFGFFVSGPGINGPYSNNSINVALLPNSSEFVSINTVNHLDNTNLYVRNEIEEDAAQCSLPFVQAFQNLIQYDGMTVPLTATIDVIPCETYHIRLVVADVGDDQLDSGVFLEMESFDLTGDVDVSAEVPGSDDQVALEGCRNGQFVFRREQENINQPLVVYFNIGPSSTAESGIDFAPLPDSIIIPAGQVEAVLPVIVFDDMITEPIEQLSLQLDFPCDCEDPIAATLFIREAPLIEIDETEVTACAGQEFSVGPIILNGTEPYTYLWEDGSTTSTIQATISQSTDFLLTVTDACGTSTPVIIPASIQPVPNAQISGDVSVCSEDNSIEILFEGTAPWSFGYSIDGTPQSSLSSITENPFLLTVDVPGIYEINSFSDANCTGDFNGSSTVTEGIIELTYEVVAPTCFDFTDGAIQINIEGGQPPYIIEWSTNVNNDLNPTLLAVGTYEVLVTDADNCQAIETIVLQPDAGNDCLPYKMFVPNAFSPNGDGINDFFQFYPAENSNIAEVRSLHVFNRWGGVVFEKKDFIPSLNEPLWDGHFKGKLMDTGVFIWQAVLVLQDDTEAVASGDLTLIR